MRKVIKNKDCIMGGVAGLLATIPMTMFLKRVKRQLPLKEQYSLPPREIMERVAETTGLDEFMSETQLKKATMLSHYGYGTAMGALYGPLTAVMPASTIAKGSAYGLAVWAGSYLGVLPALNILRPATEHPVRRTAMMIGAHLVWGNVLAYVFDKLTSESKSPGEKKEVFDPFQANQSFS